MKLNKLRGSQLIAPFGPGAVHIMKQGHAVVTAGLDYWGKQDNGSPPELHQIQRMTIREPRLEKLLGVDHFRTPPGPETITKKDDPYLYTPLLRFPTWYVCPVCKRMDQQPLHRDGVITCKSSKCNDKKPKSQLVQVRFAAVCEHGHLQDFPWLEWVHRAPQKDITCSPSDLEYKAGGSGSLADIKIKCHGCNVKDRSLSGIMDSSENGSTLSRTLLKKDKNDNPPFFPCGGKKVWLGEDMVDDCNLSMRGVLINATNLHYALIRSAIRLPRNYENTDDIKILEILKQPRYKSFITIYDGMGDETSHICKKLKEKSKEEGGSLHSYSDSSIEKNIDSLRGIGDPSRELSEESSTEIVETTPEFDEILLRREEYSILIKETDDDDLVVTKPDMNRLPDDFQGLISDISLIQKLKETRVFSGFTRLSGGVPNDPDAPNSRDMLWREKPIKRSENWLPANIVHGEGFFIELNREALSAWERKDWVIKMTAILQRNYEETALERGWQLRNISSRFILIHSLTHALINQLVFECGYGSSSLREKIYVEKSDDADMTGALIYTASGDTEGSMGGLVRMGEPEKLAEVIFKALNKAKWCGGDPVCGESHLHGGQGLNHLNLAACRSCLLLPETCCEEYNRFLDRSFLTGVLGSEDSGFFSEVIK